MAEGFGWTQYEIPFRDKVKQMGSNILKTLNKTPDWKKWLLSGIVLPLSASLTTALYCSCQPLSCMYY